jgi:hypothetical protein
MPSSSATTTDLLSVATRLPAATRLAEAVEGANTLLYHAITGGQDLAPTVRDPIIKARIAVERGEPLSGEAEGAFLDAYSRLALRVAPVTASTLEATSRKRARRGWTGVVLGLSPISDAQRLASRFGLLAVCLIFAIALGEWTRTFIGSISAAESQFGANAREMREAEIRRGSIEDQIGMLTKSEAGAPDTANAGAVREALKARKAEVDARIWGLDYANGQLRETIDQGYATLGRVFLFVSSEKLKHVSAPVGTILGGFVLPVLYGALGTCAFIMRSLYREMVDRTFDARRTGEFTVRIFLGMLSGLTLQWLLVRPDGTGAAGATPAVLAFLGGYSVEMLFTAMDRLVHLVAGRMRPAHRAQPGGRPPSRERTMPGGSGPRRARLRDALANGTALGHPAPTSVTALAPVRADS